MILRKATIEDWAFLLEWRNDIETRNNSHNIDLVEAESHKKWLNSILQNEYRRFYVAIDNDRPVGTVRADYDSFNDDYELSWTIAPDMRGKGIGKTMVKLLADSLNAKLRAEIKSGNVASVRIAEHVGLKLQKEVNGVLYYSNY